MLSPLHSHQFRLRTVNHLDTDLTITQSVINVTVDIKQRNLQVQIRESMNGEIFRAVANLCVQNQMVYLEYLTPDGDAVAEIRFQDMHIVGHQLVLAYDNTDMASHCITWQFKKILVHPNTNKHPIQTTTEIKVPQGQFITIDQVQHQL